MFNIKYELAYIQISELISSLTEYKYTLYKYQVLYFHYIVESKLYC